MVRILKDWKPLAYAERLEGMSRKMTGVGGRESAFLTFDTLND